MIIVPDVAATYDLDAFLGSVATWFHLFTNELDLDSATVIGMFQEADWSGYGPFEVSTWTPALMIGGRAVSTADPVEWTRTALGDPREVYGYFVTDGPSGPLLWCESCCGVLFIPMQADQDVIVVWPRITGRGEPGEPCIYKGGVEVS